MMSRPLDLALSSTSTGSPCARTNSAPESTSSTECAFFNPLASSFSTICGLCTTCPSVVTSPRCAIASSAFFTVIATPKQNPCDLALRISTNLLRERGNRAHYFVRELRQLIPRCFPIRRKRHRRAECDFDPTQALRPIAADDTGRHNRRLGERCEQRDPHAYRGVPTEVACPLREDADATARPQYFDRTLDGGGRGALAIDRVRADRRDR